MNDLSSDPLVCEQVKKTVLYSKKNEESGERTISESFKTYHRQAYLKHVFIVACIICAILVSGYSLTIGSLEISFTECYVVIWKHITGNVDNVKFDHVIINMRLPRIACGLIAGAGLAVAGVAMQSILKNPLADPYTTGVSSGAGFGATLSMAAGISAVGGAYSLVVNAFIFSLIPTAVIIFVAKMKNASPTTMIMAGIAIMYIFNAMSTILKLWSDPNDLAALYQWQVGSLANVEWIDNEIMLAIVTVGSILIMILSKKLNVLSTGDDSAKAMGVDVEQLRIMCMLIVAVLCAGIVSFTGLIGFIGLVAPHVVRMVIGADNRYLVPGSIAFGALLLVVSDLVGRIIIAPTILQVGVITSFLGGPLFLFLILRSKKEVWG